ENMFVAALLALDPDAIAGTQELRHGYRIDVLLRRGTIELAVELDGHDFHERTRQQASYDRARDRELLRQGVPTIRFTGHDVYRDANQCAREALDVLADISDELAWQRHALEHERREAKRAADERA